MSLLRSIGSIASSSIVTQVIGLCSIWLLSHHYGMSDVGIYALTFSIVLIGAQVCTFASQLLLPKQTEDRYTQNVVFCLLQSALIALPYAVISSYFFSRDPYFLYLLTLCHAWVLISENMLLRDEKMNYLALQRLSVSIIVFLSILLTSTTAMFYWSWAIVMLLLVIIWLSYSLHWSELTIEYFRWKSNKQFLIQNIKHLSGVGSAEVLAMVNANLPTILINLFFSPLTAGYFAVVNRFCLSPVIIVGNAVRNSIFSKWSLDFRHQRFNYPEFKKVRALLFGLAIVAVIGVFVFYPIVMNLAFGDEWISSIPTSQYMLPYLFVALAISPLTVVELVFGSPRYFFQIQIGQLMVILAAFFVFPYFYSNYENAVLLYSVFTFILYLFIYRKVNRRAHDLDKYGI